MSADRQTRRMNDEIGPNPFRIGTFRWVGVVERRRLEREQLEREQLEKEQAEKELLEKEQVDQEQAEEGQLNKELLEQENLEEEHVSKEQLCSPVLVNPDTPSTPHQIVPFNQRIRPAFSSHGTNTFRMGGSRYTNPFMIGDCHRDEAPKKEPRKEFQQTRLGNLPGEIRTLIYEYALIAPPSHVITRNGSITQSTDPTIASEEIPLATLTISGRPKLPCNAMLQVCRQICQEAYHIFYARNAFSFATAQELRDFLVQIGPLRRQELRTLHVDRLLTPARMWTDEDVDRLCVERHLDEAQRQNYATSTYKILGPEAMEATRILKGCKKLSKIVFGIEENYDALSHARFFLSMSRYRMAQIDFVDESHWVVRDSESTDHWYEVVFMQLKEVGAYAKLFGKGQHRIEVGFMVDPTPPCG